MRRHFLGNCTTFVGARGRDSDARGRTTVLSWTGSWLRNRHFLRRVLQRNRVHRLRVILVLGSLVEQLALIVRVLMNLTLHLVLATAVQVCMFFKADRPVLQIRLVIQSVDRKLRRVRVTCLLLNIAAVLVQVSRYELLYGRGKLPTDHSVNISLRPELSQNLVITVA